MLSGTIRPDTNYSRMAPRPLWTGQLRLSLVSIPVELYSATKSGARISFRQIHKPSGKPIRYQKVVSGVGPVKADDIVQGYAYEKDKYLLIDPDEVAAIKLETKKTLSLVQFVGSCEIPPLYFDKPYYLVPANELAEEAYRVVRDALRQSEKVGLGQITLRGREMLVAVKPCGDGLLLETLFYDDEIRNADPLFSSVDDEEVDSELLEVASALIEKKTAPFDAAAFSDNYSDALRGLIDSKMKAKSSKKVELDDDDDARSAGDSNVIDLMSALKRSLDGATSSAAKAAKKKPAARAKKPAAKSKKSA